MVINQTPTTAKKLVKFYSDNSRQLASRWMNVVFDTDLILLEDSSEKILTEDDLEFIELEG